MTTRSLRLSISLGAVLAAAVGCGGKTAINIDGGEGDAIAVTTGQGGNPGSGGSVATTGSGGIIGTGGTTGAGGASGSAGTTGAGGAIGNGGTTGTGGGAGGQTGVDAGIMMCVAGAVCPTVNASCMAPCGGGMVRLCFCDPNGRVACQNCQPPPPPACAANVVSGRACNPGMNALCGGCVNRQTETCTCMPVGGGGGGGGRGVWNCVIPVPVQACQ